MDLSAGDIKTAFGVLCGAIGAMAIWFRALYLKQERHLEQCSDERRQLGERLESLHRQLTEISGSTCGNPDCKIKRLLGSKR